MMETQPKANGGDARRVARGKQRPEQVITLAAAGIDKHLATRARTAAAMTDKIPAESGTYEAERQ